MVKKFDTIVGSRTYVINYYNKIKVGTLISDEFVRGSDTYQLIENTTTGLMDEYKNGSLFVSGVGSINHDDGIVTLGGYNFLVELSDLQMIATPELEDIDTVRNNLLLLGSTTINQTVDQAIIK